MRRITITKDFRPFPVKSKKRKYPKWLEYFFKALLLGLTLVAMYVFMLFGAVL